MIQKFNFEPQKIESHKVYFLSGPNSFRSDFGPNKLLPICLANYPQLYLIIISNKMLFGVSKLNQVLPKSFSCKQNPQNIKTYPLSLSTTLHIPLLFAVVFANCQQLTATFWPLGGCHRTTSTTTSHPSHFLRFQKSLTSLVSSLK